MSPVGFTLIELLAVIAVVGVLAGLGLPALARAKRLGINSHCAGNLRQIGLALRLYAEDNRGRLPAMPIRAADDNLGNRFRATLSLDVPALLKCRADQEGHYNRNGTSYEWNDRYNGKLLHGTAAAIGAGPNSAAIMADFAPWHGHKNGVFPDGHVAKAAIWSATNNNRPRL